MKINLDKLPEKDYFSFEEVAERWSCDLETIRHFIYEQKILHPALVTKKHEINFACRLNDENYPEFEKLDRLLSVTVDSSGGNPSKLYIPQGHEEEGVRDLIDSLNLELLNQGKVRKNMIPQYFYQVPTDIMPMPGMDIYKSMVRKSIMRKEDVYGFYISARDFSGNKYVFFTNIAAPRVITVTPKMFNVITREERDRFEKEYGINDNTSNVGKKVNAKTENMYLELIQFFAGSMLKDGLSDSPFSDVAKIEEKLARQGKQLPCSTETLAKYLKQNRL